MRENRLYGSEGGGALTRSPYPYRPHPVPLRDDFVNRPDAEGRCGHRPEQKQLRALHG